MTTIFDPHPQKTLENNDEGPESLFIGEPYKDPYSSDNETGKRENSQNADELNPKRKRKQEKTIWLPKHSKCSDLSGVKTLFFFDLDYSSYPSSQLDLTNSSEEHILGSIFKFIFRCDRYKNDDKRGDCKDGDNDDNSKYILNGETMSHLFNITLLECHELAWMRENDVLNYKTCSSATLIETKKYLSDIKRERNQQEGCASSSIKYVVDFMDTLMTQYCRNKMNDSNSVKTIFRTLGNILPWNTSMKYSGEINYKIHYRVSEDIASDNSSSKSKIFTQGDRMCEIEVCPDAVYEADDIPRIVVQVFAPQDVNSTTSSEDGLSQNNQEQFPEKPGQVHQKPEQRKDAILNKEYRKIANEYLKQFVFHDCSDSASINKFMGDHIAQLIGLALNIRGNQPTKRIIGIFMKNEYIYMSKLLINSDKLSSYMYRPAVMPFERLSSEIGKIKFANWRIDLTLSSHRIAFIVFLVNFLGKFCQ